MDFGLGETVRVGRRRAHENAPVPVRLDAFLQTGQRGIGQHFLPAGEVEGGLILPGRKADGESGHDPNATPRARDFNPSAQRVPSR